MQKTSETRLRVYMQKRQKLVWEFNFNCSNLSIQYVKMHSLASPSAESSQLQPE